MKKVNIAKEDKKKNNKSFFSKLRERTSVKLIIVNIALIIFVAYAFVTLVNQQVQISAKAKELEEIKESTAVLQAENEEMKRVCNVLEKLGSDTKSEDYQRSLRYIEKIAREEYNYASKGERIFINIAGE